MCSAAMTIPCSSVIDYIIYSICCQAKQSIVYNLFIILDGSLFEAFFIRFHKAERSSLACVLKEFVIQLKAE